MLVVKRSMLAICSAFVLSPTPDHIDCLAEMLSFQALRPPIHKICRLLIADLEGVHRSCGTLCQQLPLLVEADSPPSLIAP
jgi:hypothetical protein